MKCTRWMCSLQQKPRLKETSSIWYTETWPFFKFVSDSKKTISWNASKNVMVSSRKSRAKVREGKKPFEVSVVVQQRVVVHTAVKIWKTDKLIYVQCLCLKCLINSTYFEILSKEKQVPILSEDYSPKFQRVTIF